MMIAVAEITIGIGPKDYFYLCQIDAKDSDSGLLKLKSMLSEEGIEAEKFGHKELKWKDVYFHVVEIGPPTDLHQMLPAVKEAQRMENNRKRFKPFLNLK